MDVIQSQIAHNSIVHHVQKRAKLYTNEGRIRVKYRLGGTYAVK